MTPRPGTVHTASSAKTSRRAKPSLRANASNMPRTSVAFGCSAAMRSLGQAALPALEQRLEHVLLVGGEAGQPEQPAHLARVVVGDGGPGVLPRVGRLAQGSARAQPG